MRVGVALLVGCLMACGRSGFDDNGDAAPVPDFSPDPVAWPDFPTVSAIATFSGINQPIEVEVITTFGVGTPLVELSLGAGAWDYVTPSAPVLVIIQPEGTLQFRVLGATSDTAFITVSNESTGGTLLDTTLGTVASLVTGDGTQATPYTVPSPPASCNEFLVGYPEQDGRDGIHVTASAAVDCDMTTDGGGWMLVARVTATSTVHDSPGGVGTLTDRSQATVGKFADNFINAFGFTQARLSIDTVGTVYVNTSALDLSSLVNYSIANSAAPALQGPYTHAFRTSNNCSGDCGAAVVSDNLGFGPWCGYRYYSSAGNRRPGMGCQGNFGKNGTVWVR